jgi:pyrrolysine biosynthesis protein PylD
LETNDIHHIVAGLTDYDKALIDKTDRSLRGIACYAAGVDESDMQCRLNDVLVGVVPITGGKGKISGFCDTVAGIVAHIGCRAFITRMADVGGLAEAFEKRADIVLLADDDCFIAIHVQSRRVVENAMATGKGFAAGLALMTGGLKGQKVLVLGCGPVGCSAAETLVQRGAHVAVYDIHRPHCQNLADKIKRLYDAEMAIEEELDPALAGHQYIVDATPAAGIISAHYITPETYVSAPGVPLGLDAAAQSIIGSRLLHDPLQIGVATMVIEAVCFSY